MIYREGACRREFRMMCRPAWHLNMLQFCFFLPSPASQGFASASTYVAVCRNTKEKGKENGNCKEKCHWARNSRGYSFYTFSSLKNKAAGAPETPSGDGSLLQWKCRKIKYSRRAREGGRSMYHQQYFGERLWTKDHPPISLGLWSH